MAFKYSTQLYPGYFVYNVRRFWILFTSFIRQSPYLVYHWVLVYFCGLWFPWQLIFRPLLLFWSVWLIWYFWRSPRSLCLRGQRGFFSSGPQCLRKRKRSLRPVGTSRFPRPSACCSGNPLTDNAQQSQCLWAWDGSLRPTGSKGFPG